MIVINLFGQPSAGKSTGAAYIFSKLKMAGFNVELVTEYAKDKTWEDNSVILDNQLYVLGQQSQRLWRCKDKVDIVITDSPILLTPIYNHMGSNELKSAINTTAIQFSNMFDNYNFFVLRDKPYNNAGRNQTEDEADKIGLEIEQYLLSHNVPYTTVEGNENGYNTIVNYFIQKEKLGEIGIVI